MKSRAELPTRNVQASRVAPEEFLTTQDLMKLLKVKHKQTIYQMIREGMPVIRVGRHYRFMKEEVINFLKTHSNANATKSKRN